MSEFVPEGWSEARLADITQVITKGTTPKKYTTKGINFVKVESVSGSATLLPSKFAYIDNVVHESFKRSQLSEGDILFSIAGSLGRLALVENQHLPANTNQALAIIRLKKGVINTNFCIQQLKGEQVQSELVKLQTVGAQPNLSLQQISDICLKVPPLPEQQKIAAILTSVDEVIEKTQAQINKLKDLKTGMMQELLTRGVGVDGKPHTEFKDSPVGRIPKAWEVLPLSKVAKLERGKFSHRPRNDPSFYNGDIPFLQTGDIPKKSPYITKYSQTLNEKGLGVSKLFPIGTLVITIAATIGEIGILKFDSCFPDSLVGIKIDMEKADTMYILYVMRHLKDELDLLAPQTAQKNINLDILNPFVVPVPPLKEQKQISQALESIDARLNILDEKLTKIQKTKKALMQDLLTGKVRVKIDIE